MLVWGVMPFPWWFPWAHPSLLLVVFPEWGADTFDVVTAFSICIGWGEAPSTYESQNRLSRPTPCPKQGQLEQVSQGQSGLEYFQRLRFHNLFGEPLTTFNVWGFSGVFLCLNGTSGIWIYAHLNFGPFIVHHWEDSGLIFFSLSHQLFTHIEKTFLSLLFSRLLFSSSNSLSFSLYEWCSSPLAICIHLCWTRSSISVSLFYWGARNWTQRSPTSTEYRGIITPRPLLAMLLANTTQDVASIQAYLLPHASANSHTIL